MRKKINENDPTHDTVIRLLEKQGSHSKAQFIVNAILHYVNCSETPDISVTQTADRASIEEIVMEILSSRENGQQDTVNGIGSRKAIREGPVSAGTSEQRTDAEPKQEAMDEAAWVMIADTMSAFRNS